MDEEECIPYAELDIRRGEASGTESLGDIEEILNGYSDDSFEIED